MSDTSITQQELTPGQKDYVVRCYGFMSKAKEDGIFRGQRTRDLVAACLQIARGTASTLMNAYRADKEAKFEPKSSQRGKKASDNAAIAK
ncbi:hypothetical protein PC129_g4912 [Phytophthora cactorum]|uniref:Uncharacterized protein n=1 Tax=Phytophthora cactorum TaxID=29920 RepID=A0A329R8Z9_9STRA|nr:hypothetical protein Pcac1_g1825 [Phytophthora cactorum]KAG2831853.1 hypothetical protein PC112_g7114 [Phytophthora cactorum]KAG2834316.1 hypothetical protein PC111_g5873 [Phytophthora cactorum]KAG2861710.1 hypothetical protein PC113_g6917 [Phytophthora cactorum]KAG2910273.1 hypothetical protein PC114_g9845 [Phytophthora cactorum]